MDVCTGCYSLLRFCQWGRQDILSPAIRPSISEVNWPFPTGKKGNKQKAKKKRTFCRLKVFRKVFGIWTFSRADSELWHGKIVGVNRGMTKKFKFLKDGLNAPELLIFSGQWLNWWLVLYWLFVCKNCVTRFWCLKMVFTPASPGHAREAEVAL